MVAAEAIGLSRAIDVLKRGFEPESATSTNWCHRASGEVPEVAKSKSPRTICWVNSWSPFVSRRHHTAANRREC